MRTWRAEAGGAGAALALAGGLLVLVLLLAGCPPTGAVCGAGLTACGGTCVDLRSDTAHCGACGTACGAEEVCQEGACGCREGALLCGGACVDPEADSRHCGACGQACGAEEACDRGACRPVLRCEGTACVGAEACDGARCVCPAGRTLCGSVCVDLASDVDHCGACGAACSDVQACRAGACRYDVVAACQNTGQLVGLRTSGLVGPPVQLPGPLLQSLAVDRDLLLVGETDGDLQQVALAGLFFLGGAVDTGQSPNHLLVDPPYVYVVESLTTNSLLVFRREEGARSPGGGATLTLLAQLPLGEGTSPQAIAKVGSTLFIPLLGGFGSEEAARQGQRVARVDVSDPTRPARNPAQDIDLTGLDLRTFPGQRSFPYPSGITALNGALYLPLANYDPHFQQTAEGSRVVPGGPGLLAKVDPTTGVASVVELDAEACLTALSAVPVAGMLAVSCQGRVQYDSRTWSVTGVEKSALVLLDGADRRVATYAFTCPGDPAACGHPVAGKVAVAGSRVYVGDQSRGRVVVLEATRTGLTEQRGFHGAGGPPLQVCPPASNGGNSVADLVVVP